MRRDAAARGGARTRTNTASADLRATLWELLSEDRGALWTYRRLCKYAHELPDSDIFSDRFALEPAQALLQNMHWEDVYAALEALYRDAGRGERETVEAKVNDSLARSSIAYVMQGGLFEDFDAEAQELGLEDADASSLLTGKYAPVAPQYQKALKKLHAVPSDYEGALADALNAIEAVAKIATGSTKGTLSDVVKSLFPDGAGYHQPLREAITKLYAYSNQVPGGRHGRWAEPQIAHLETAFVVRTVGALIALIVGQERVNATAKSVSKTGIAPPPWPASVQQSW